MKNNKSIKILFILCLIYLIIRLSILLSSPYILNYGEIRMGFIAKEIIKNPKTNLFEYQFFFGSHQGGLIINSLLTIPLFYIFGEHGITIKLLWLLTSLGTLIILFYFLNKFFNKTVAILASLFFILSPQLFTIYTLTDAATYTGAVFFTILIMFLFYNTFLNKTFKLKNLILFSFICGFALYFELSSLVMIFTCILFWFIFNKKFFLKKEFFIFLIFFLIGFSPSIFYNLTHSFGGYQRLYPSNFFQPNIITSSATKLFNLLTQDLPNSLNQIWNFKEQIPLILLNYTYYLIFIISFIYLIYLNRKNILKTLTGLIPHTKFNINPTKFKKVVFILAYFIIFILIYSVSNYNLGPGNWTKEYRFILPAIPFIFIIIALFITNLLKNKNKIFRYTALVLSTILIIIGIISNVNLIGFNNWNLGDNSIYQPYNYKFLGIDTSWRFSNVFSVISICNKIPVKFRNDCFLGLDKDISRHFSQDIYGVTPPCNKIPIEFRDNCFKGLNIDFSNDLDSAISIAISSCNELPIEFNGDCFKGIGVGISKQFGHTPSAISACNKIPSKFRSNCLEGLNETIGKYSNEGFFSAISACNKFPTELKSSCFFELGKVLGGSFVDYKPSCNEIPVEFRNDCLKGLKSSNL